jgi:hypothetical protein
MPTVVGSRFTSYAKLSMHAATGDFTGLGAVSRGSAVACSHPMLGVCRDAILAVGGIGGM